MHSAITGKSAFIRANGDVVATTELLETGNLLGEVRFRIASPTLYTRFGDWLLLVAAALGAIAIALPGGRPEAGAGIAQTVIR